MRLIRLALPIIILIASLPVCALQGTPEIFTVEPPGWWARYSMNPVRLLIRGKNLKGAKVSPIGKGLQTSNVKASASGTYLFVDLTIDSKAQPGVRKLKITTP